MVKTSKDQIQLDEIKVLDALKQNSKENIDEIAQNCEFSRQKVWRIIKNLEKNKIIWGHTAIADEEAYGFKHYVLLVIRSLEPIAESHKKEIVFDKLDNYLPGLVKIEDIYYTHGTYDLVITFYASQILHAKNFIKALFNKNNKLFKDYLFLETIFPIRKKNLKNPQIKKLVEYL